MPIPTDQPMPETAPDDADHAACPHCGRPFPEDHLLELHLGERHGEALSETDRGTYEEAREREAEELFLFHLKVIAAIGILYSIFVVVYMVVLG